MLCKKLFVAISMLGLLIPMQVSSKPSDDDYQVDVKILNKAKLPKKELADAILAKALLMWQPKLIKTAAELVPTDPTYVYYQISPDGDPEYGSDHVAADAKLLKQALKLDPNYLPALYQSAMLKPSVDEQLKDLEHIADIDKDNAKPYYLMAVLLYRHLTDGKEPIPESDGMAKPISEQDWSRIIGYIKQGNSRPSLRATKARIPALNSIEVYSSNKKWPRKAVESTFVMMNEYTWDRGFADYPFDLVSCMIVRQLTVQSHWHSRHLNTQGNRAAALDELATIHGFGDKIAATEPFKMTFLQTGAAINRIAWDAEFKMGQSDELLKSNILKWSVVPEPKPKSADYIVDVKDVYILAGQNLAYIDCQKEADDVLQLLKKLGLK